MQQLKLDRVCYTIEAVQKAAYRFIDRLTVQIAATESEWICDIQAVKVDADVDALISDFKRELIDQELREKIKAETEPIRTLILSLAFSESGLQK